jgi:hypothetical protein
VVPSGPIFGSKALYVRHKASSVELCGLESALIQLAPRILRISSASRSKEQGKDIPATKRTELFSRLLRRNYSPFVQISRKDHVLYGRKQVALVRYDIHGSIEEDDVVDDSVS